MSQTVAPRKRKGGRIQAADASQDMPGQNARDGLIPISTEGFASIERLTRDIRSSGALMGDTQARFFVDLYYSMQKYRIGTDHQVRQLRKSNEPQELTKWYAQQFGEIEKQIVGPLEQYSASKIEGRWARSIVGIGPIIVAGLLANAGADPERTTVGKLWSFAGLNPDRKWGKGQKRPWNATLKRLAFIIGESFTKFQDHSTAHLPENYGRYLKARRRHEIRGNDEGRFADQARQTLIDKKFGKDTEALAWYSGCYPAGTCAQWTDFDLRAREMFPAPEDPTERAAASRRRLLWLTTQREDFLQAVRLPAGQGLPMLPPARILLRAQRWPVKLFLSHWHHVTWEANFGTPPRMPYILDAKAAEPFPELKPILSAHGNYIKPPNWPMGSEVIDRAAEAPNDVEE